MEAPLVLFVYGTLMRGFRNHYRLLDSEFIGPAWTKPIYRLYDCGTYPGLVWEEDGESIGGELFRVTSEVMAALDEFERQYERKPVELNSTGFDAWGFFYRGNVSALPRCGPLWTSP